MIIPISCFTCGKILGDKWLFYQSELQKLNPSKEDSIINISKPMKKTPECIVLDKLELDRYCCRRIMLGHVDLIDII
jgi:DNA-directed RNA polymerase subunit N